MEAKTKPAITAEAYWNLPEDRHCELMDGELFDLATPSRMHQELVGELYAELRNHTKTRGRDCRVYPAPFSVTLFADQSAIVEPDISVICDSSKLSDRGCEGAPDLIVEVVSPSSRMMDYMRKYELYSRAGVKEYWIVDPMKQATTVYFYENGPAPEVIPFSEELRCNLCGLTVVIAELIS